MMPLRTCEGSRRPTAIRTERHEGEVCSDVEMIGRKAQIRHAGRSPAVDQQIGAGNVASVVG